MKNNQTRSEVLDYIQPFPIFKYQHLSENEILWLYRNESNIDRKIEFYKRFKEEYPNLKIFERELSIEKIKSNKGNIYFIHWYILRLVEYKRISLNLEILINLKLKSRLMLSVNSYLINLGFMNRFKNTAIDKLGYSKEHVERTLMIDLIRGLLYYQVKVDDFIAKINDYYETVSKKVKDGTIHVNHKKTTINIIYVLKQMGYDIKFDFNYEPNITSTGKLLRNSHTEIRVALEEYAEFLKNNKKGKTAKTELSHLRAFFNFLFDYYPNVDKFKCLNNDHVRRFIEVQKTGFNIQGKCNSNSTINHRLQALKKMLIYFEQIDKYGVNPNIITKYDMLKETSSYTKYRSEQEIIEVIKAIINAQVENETQKQCKLALIILATTGRRIHEVLSLRLDCYKDNKVFFHKTKNDKNGWQIVGEATINAIRVLKEYAQNIKTEIYSPYDYETKRRLFPSKKYKGKRVLSKDTVERFFTKLQIENGIVNDKGKAKYTLHDNKRNFIACMLSAGVSSESIAKFLNQETSSLIPYEVDNRTAIKALKSAEGKKLLIGESYYKKIEKDNSRILKLLDDVDVISRNKQNLILKINNPKENIPLFLGYCTDYNNYEICGDLVCLACDEFRTDSIDDFRKYAIKMYKYIYSFKRDEIVRKIERKLLIALEKVYENIALNKVNTFDQEVKSIKKIAREEINE